MDESKPSRILEIGRDSGRLNALLMAALMMSNQYAGKRDPHGNYVLPDAPKPKTFTANKYDPSACSNSKAKARRLRQMKGKL